MVEWLQQALLPNLQRHLLSQHKYTHSLAKNNVCTYMSDLDGAVAGLGGGFKGRGYPQHMTRENVVLGLIFA